MRSSSRPGVATTISTPLQKRADLGLLAHAAENDGMAERDVAAVKGDALVDLRGQFPGGGEDERPRPARRAGLRPGGEALQDRQRERGRLAGAGLGAADEVAAFQQGRDRLRLDGRRLGVGLFDQRAQQRRGQVQRGKGDGGVLIHGGRADADASGGVHPGGGRT